MRYKFSFKSIICVIIILFITIGVSISQSVYINEFMASNVSTYPDIEGLSDFADWIELYNSTNNDINISGYYISDKNNDTIRWRIPEGAVIKAKSFFMITADGNDAKPGDRFQLPYHDEAATVTRYYADFSLSKLGETITLYNRSGNIMDQVKFGNQLPDVSYGRKPDGGENWYYFGEPTPENSNITQGLNSLSYADSPIFAPEGNIYDNTVLIELSAVSTIAQIYYTLDGSIPTRNSFLYNSPIEIKSTTIIRARIFENSKIPGKIITQTYFVQPTLTDLPVVSFVADPYYLFDEEKGIYSNNYKQREIPAHIEYYQSFGNKSFNVNAGARIGGMNIWRFSQKPLTLYLNGKYGDEAINYPLFKERENIGSYSRVVFRNAGDDWNDCFMRDAMMQQLLVGRMENSYQAYQPVQFYLNGEYWGILEMREKFDNKYFLSHYNLSSNNYDHMGYTYDELHRWALVVNNGDDIDYQKMVEFFENNDLSNVTNYIKASGYINIDNFIDWALTEIYVANTSWPWNHEWWRNKALNGSWNWMIVDMDRGFNLDKLEYNLIDEFHSYYNTVPPLLEYLCENENFKEYYLQRFAAHINTTFNPDRVIYIIDSIQQILKNEMPRHIERWKNDDGISSISKWNSNVEEMRTFAKRRPEIVFKDIMDYYHISDTTNIIFSVNDKHSGTIYINNVEITDSTYKIKLFKNIPLQLKALPRIGYEFSHWTGINSESNELEITPEEDISITAVFIKSSQSILPSIFTKDTVLTIDNSPYYGTGDIIVNPYVTLQINEGVEINMPENAGFYIYGNLLISGSETNKVVIKPNPYLEAETWGALCFKNTTDNSVLKNLVLEKPTRGKGPYDFFAAISAYNSNLAMDNIKIENISTQPIFTQYGNIELKNSYLHSLVTCDLINIKYANSALIENCEFVGNNAYDTDAIDYDQISNGIIRNNYIHDFLGFNSDAIDLGENASNIYVYNNLITNCTDKGISVGQASSAIAEHNIIARCNMGFGVKDDKSTLNGNNNTLFGNNIGIACYEKNFLSGGGIAFIKNTIIADSRIQTVLVDDLSYMSVSYSLSNTGLLPGTNNICGHPGMINPEKYNFSLLTNSLSINSGDPSSPLDPDGTRSDIGALYYQKNEIQSLTINEINYNPSYVFNNGQWIELYNNSNQTINLENWKLITTGGSYTFPAGSKINSNTYLVICSNTNLFKLKHPSITSYIQYSGLNLKSSAESILLQDPTKTTIDSLTFSGKSPWPLKTNGTGFTLSLIKPYLNNENPLNWKASWIIGGTPGESNDPNLKGKIVINELISLNSLERDDYNQFDDWIELYNQSDRDIDINGLYITDDLALKNKFRLFDATDENIIPPNGYKLLWADSEPEQGSQHLNFSLDRDGEQLALIDNYGTNIIDSISFPYLTGNISYGRSPKNSSIWTYLMPTPLEANQEYFINYISSESKGGSFIVFPNPVSNEINIQLPANNQSQIMIEIIDAYGRIIYMKNFNSLDPFITINISDFQNGLFIIKLYMENKIYIQKIIKI